MKRLKDVGAHWHFRVQPYVGAECAAALPNEEASFFDAMFFGERSPMRNFRIAEAFVIDRPLVEDRAIVVSAVKKTHKDKASLSTA